MPPLETVYGCPGGAIVGGVDESKEVPRYWYSLRCRAIRCALGDVRCGKSISTYLARSGGVARDCDTV